jgi:hypothetical protein
MNAKHASSIMFVGLGIFAGLWGVAVLESAFMSFNFGSGAGPLRYILPVALFIPFLILVWAAVHLIRHHERYANALFPGPALGPSSFGLDQLYVIAFSLIGIYLIVESIPQLVHWGATTLVLSLHAGRSSGASDADYAARALGPSIGELASQVVRMGIGIALVAYRSKITKLMLREPAVPPPMAHCPNCGNPYNPSDYVGGSTSALCSKCRIPLPGVGA